MSHSFNISGHGSVTVVSPTSVASRDLLEDFIDTYAIECQRWGADGIVVEPRYLRAFLDGLQEFEELVS